jgi:hypothetical protein
MKVTTNTGFASAFDILFAAQVNPFMLSSAHTARTHVKESGDEEEVIIDAEIALGATIVFSCLMGYLFQDAISVLIGSLFGITLFIVYLYRGNLLE